MSKATRPRAKKAASKGKTLRKPRAAALVVAEPRLTAPRTSHATTKKARSPKATTEHASSPMVRLMLDWSPLGIMLRQQAMLASVLSTLTMRPKN